MKQIAPLVLATMLLAACDPAAENKPAARPEPLNVYASHPDFEYLPRLFAGFTDETGIHVVVRHRSDRENVDAMVGKRDVPPADLLLTGSVAEIWRAAEEGALRPFDAALAASVPRPFLDPDRLWTAISIDPAVIVSAGGDADAPTPAAYADLADPVFRDRLCLSTSRLPGNRTLIAFLIGELGQRPAELVVRGWMTNLALPPMDDERALLSAIAEGRCSAGIASLSAVRRWRADGRAGSFAVSGPPAPFADIKGAGIGRHAESPDAAEALLRWLLSDPVQARIAAALGHDAAVAAGEPTAGLPSMNAAGRSYAEAVRLAERAGYR